MKKSAQKKGEKSILTDMGLVLFFKLNIWIVAPVLGSIFLGKWLDRKMETESKFTVILIGVAFVFSMVGLIVESKRAMKEMDDIGKEKAKKPKIQQQEQETKKIKEEVSEKK